jgi:ABC-type nitrate/sulfonate/bicarbonate transport system substrate-binding protein
MVINSNDKVKMIRRFKSILVLIGIIVLIFGSLSCQGRYSGPMESMTIGAQLLESSIPLFIAQDQEFFRQNGLDVTLKGYDTGLAALNGILNGEVDVATSVSEYILIA